jgi:uncharacterized protein (TIGR03000 family)
MYSVVLMMAMTGAGDAPAGMLHHGCCGGCSGYSCSGCYGCCGGCCGGGKHHGGHGCCGGKHHGGHHGCHGCHGCCGGCYGCTGGCWGSCYGSSCYGSSCYGGACYGCGGAVVPATPVAPADGGTIRDPGKKTGMVPAPATIVVSLPAEARLMIDETATASSSERRVFVSPELNPGQEYHYTLKAEWVRDGKPVVVSKQITVSAGNETAVTIEAGNLADVASR